MGTGVEAFEGDGSVRRVRTGDGGTVDCDFAVLGIGVVPRVELPEAAGRETDNGIQHADQLSAKVVVDITNPIKDSFDGLAVPADSSATQEFARLADDARFVKAFNTTFAGTLTGAEVAGQQLDVLIAGDDEEAKQAVARLARDGGLNPIDARATGPRPRARGTRLPAYDAAGRARHRLRQHREISLLRRELSGRGPGLVLAHALEDLGELLSGLILQRLEGNSPA